MNFIKKKTKLIGLSAILILIILSMTTCSNDSNDTKEFNASLDADYLTEGLIGYPYRITTYYLDAMGQKNYIYNESTAIDRNRVFKIPQNAMLIGFVLEVNIDELPDPPERFGGGWITIAQGDLFNSAYHPIVLSDFGDNRSSVVPFNFNNLNKINAVIKVQSENYEGDDYNHFFWFDIYVNNQQQPLDVENLSEVIIPPTHNRDNTMVGAPLQVNSHPTYIRDPVNVLANITPDFDGNIHTSFRHYLKIPKNMRNPNPENISNHIQGYSYYARRNYHILSHSDKGSRGWLFFVGNNGFAGQIGLPEGYAHPGGMQVIGDFLLVGMTGDNKAMVCLYNLTTFVANTSEPHKATLGDPVVLQPTTGKSTASVGITNVPVNISYNSSTTSADTTKYKYIFAIHRYGSGIDLYRTDIVNGLGDVRDANVHHIGFISMGKNEYDGMGLFLDENNDVWMFGFTNTTTFGDADFSYAHLYKLTYSSNSGKSFYSGNLNPQKTKNFNAGISGDPSFRWGTGLRIINPTHFSISTTERKFINNQVTVHEFVTNPLDLKIEGGAKRISGGDDDVHTYMGRHTDWEIEINWTYIGNERVRINYRYKVAEVHKNYTTLQIEGKRDDVFIGYTPSVSSGSQKVSGRYTGWYHGWLEQEYPEGLIRKVVYRLDGPGNDLNNIGFGVSLDIP